VRSKAELAYFVANEFRRPTRSQQIIAIERVSGGKLRVAAITALTHVDRASPMIRWIEQILASLGQSRRLIEPQEFEASAFAEISPEAGASYPLNQMMWLPFLNFDGAVSGGMIMARIAPWTEHEATIGRHLADAAAFATAALGRREGRGARAFTRGAGALLAALVVVAAGIIPVPMSALAPVEVASREPTVVTAGLEGVIETIAIDPNMPVVKGTVIARFADTVLRNRLEVAEREVVVAQSRLRKAAQLAFVDLRGRQELALAEAELEVKSAERDFAREMLDRATIVAPRSGTALFTDRKELIGRPLVAGERIIEIADPNDVQFRVDLPVAEAIVLKDGARVKVFLDSDPLRPVEARLMRADYQAKVRDGQPLAFRVVAVVDGPRPEHVRLGVRGTAQVYSDEVPLAFYLLRRPFTAVRQWLGI